jgi:hypothetical protein
MVVAFARTPHSSWKVPIAVNAEQPFVAKNIPIADVSFNKQGQVSVSGEVELIHVGFRSGDPLGDMYQRMPLERTFFWRYMPGDFEASSHCLGSLRFAHISKYRLVKNVSPGCPIHDYAKKDRISFSVKRETGVNKFDPNLRSLYSLGMLNLRHARLSGQECSLGSSARFQGLPTNYAAGTGRNDDQPPVRVSPPYLGPFEGCVPGWRSAIGLGFVISGLAVAVFSIRRMKGWWLLFSWLWIWAGFIFALTGHYRCEDEQHSEYCQPLQHNAENVSECVVYGVRLV